MDFRTLSYSILILILLWSYSTAICDSGWEEYDDYCYYVSDQESTWYQANKYCKEKGAQLTSILNYEEMSFIVDNLTFYSEKYWIGLMGEPVCRSRGFWWGSSNRCTLKWHWTDNSSISYIKNFLYQDTGNCVYIDYQGITRSTCNTDSVWDYYYQSWDSIYYICKKEGSVISIPEVNSTYKPRSSREERSTTNRNYPTTSTTSTTTTTTTTIITYLDGQNDNTKDINNNNKNNIVIPVVVVVIAVIVVIVVVVSLVIVCKRSHKTRSERQQDITEPNIYSVSPVIPSAPSLDIIYDSHSENVRVQGTIHDPEYHTEDDTFSRTNTDIGTQDEQVYTSLTQTSGAREVNGQDTPTIRTQDEVSSVTPSGSGNENKYAVVNKSRRDPSEVDLHDNPNYEAPNSV